MLLSVLWYDLSSPWCSSSCYLFFFTLLEKSLFKILKQKFQGECIWSMVLGYLTPPFWNLKGPWWQPQWYPVQVVFFTSPSPSVSLSPVLLLYYNVDAMDILQLRKKFCFWHYYHYKVFTVYVYVSMSTRQGHLKVNHVCSHVFHTIF